MSNQVISLTGCDGCPLQDMVMPGGVTAFVCCHPLRVDTIYEYSLHQLFDRCPLKQHSLTIQIEQDATK